MASLVNDASPESDRHAAIFATVQAVMSKALGLPPARITESLTPAEVGRWDSLAMVTVMIGLERRLGRKIPLEIGLAATSVGALVASIAALN
ncbi:acyl carrier protein [Acidisoma sp. C75]